MWHFARNISQSEIEGAASIRELLQATTRRLLIVSAVFCLACALVLTSGWDDNRVPLLMFSILVVGLLFALAYRLSQQYYLLAWLVWMAAMVVVILLGSWLLRNPSLVLLSSVLPLLAVITISGRAGLAAEAIVIALVWVVTQLPFDQPLTASQALAGDRRRGLLWTAGMGSQQRAAGRGGMVHIELR